MSSYIKTKEENLRKRRNEYEAKLYEISKSVFSSLVASSNKITHKQAAESAIEASKEFLKQLGFKNELDGQNETTD
jgi:alcohol dehydrogenase YqhD (iron-dependent ADH family)